MLSKGKKLMNDKTIIQGWNITQGDYIHSRRHDKEIEKEENSAFKRKGILFSVSAIVMLGSYFGIMMLVSNHI